jgi:hypothetical protein
MGHKRHRPASPLVRKAETREPDWNAAESQAVRVEKETQFGEEYVSVRLRTGTSLMLTPAEARQLYVKLKWVI